MRILTLTVLIAFSITVGCPAEELDGMDRFEAFVDHIKWGLSTAAVDSIAPQHLQFSQWDERAHVTRYSDRLDQCGYEMIPGYLDDSLHAVMIRFRARCKPDDEVRELYELLCKSLKHRFGKHTFRAYWNQMESEAGARMDVMRWGKTDEDWIAILDVKRGFKPRIVILGISQHLRDWFAEDIESSADEPHKNTLELCETVTSWLPTREILHAFPNTTIDTLLFQMRPPEDSLSDLGKVVAVDELPVQLEYGKPDYPMKAAYDEMGGVVWVSALVDSTGAVVDARVLKPSGVDYGFEESALASAYKCKYKPAVQDGKPVAVWVTYKVEFIIRWGH